jgi:hypothetical protein
MLPDEAVSDPALNGSAAADLPERAHTLLEMQRELLAEATAGAHASRVLGLLVDFIEAHASGALASVLLLDSETHTLKTLVAPRLPRPYSDAIDGLAIGPSAGSCGTAAFHNRLVIVEDIGTDPLWEGYRELAEAHAFAPAGRPRSAASRARGSARSRSTTRRLAAPHNARSTSSTSPPASQAS